MSKGTSNTFAAFFALAVLGSASTVTSTSCQTNLGTVDATSSCSLAGSAGGSAPGDVDGLASASASGGYTVSGNNIAVTAAVSATAYPTLIGLFGGADSSAGANVDITASFLVSGSGTAFVQLTQPAFAFEDTYGEDFATLTLQFGNYLDVTCSADPIGSPCTVAGYPFPAMKIPTNVPITLTFTTAAYAAGDPFDGAGGAGDVGSLELSFFAADGKTPVAVTETPEPGLFGMVLMGGLFLLLVARRASS